MVKYVFGLLTFTRNWNESFFETLTEFSFPSLEKGGFKFFNQILFPVFQMHFMIAFNLFTI